MKNQNHSGFGNYFKNLNKKETKSNKFIQFLKYLIWLFN